jgi:DNA invertase Pin-like site-specific DNA recombinase
MKRKPAAEAAMPATVRKIRAAVYTRKSSEEGLDMEFNSLDAQREACEAYITSQRSEGWVLVRDRYDDGGISGGTLERPALRRLLADIERGLIDVVVVYKIDRLSRALMDFAKLVEVFDANSVTFVSVTQSFNTTTSMGRLTLNILLSFAQFEREVIGERIRDKVAASRARGIWMGGFVPLGYDARDRKLLVNEVEAALVRRIFDGFVQTESGTKLVQALRAEGATTKRGRAFTKSDIYRVLSNRTYLGEAMHKGKSHPGEHAAIVPQAMWDAAHALLGARRRAMRILGTMGRPDIPLPSDSGQRTGVWRVKTEGADARTIIGIEVRSLAGAGDAAPMVAGIDEQAAERAEAIQPASTDRVFAEPDEFFLVRTDQAERIRDEAQG